MDIPGSRSLAGSAAQADIIELISLVCIGTSSSPPRGVNYGAIACHVTMDYPELVDRLIVMAPSFGSRREKFFWFYASHRSPLIH